jgi:hypothetical protein
MFPPIQPPKLRFPANKIPDLADIPVYDGPFVVEEPCLIATNVEWQMTSKNKLLLTSAAPEMGDKLEHKCMGGKLTICVLCYGDYPELHETCLDSILRTVPLNRLDLRVAANCVGQASMNYLRTLPTTKLYVYKQNAYKYPIMRDMLWDPEQPITTNYFVWFDDNAHVRHNNWVNMLASEIIMQPASVGMYGVKLYYAFDLETEDPRDWLAGQRWHKGKSLRTARGNPAPNGDCTHFCADWFFAMRTDIVKPCDVPALGLQQRAGAMVIGEQLYQQGVLIKNFNAGKALIYTPDYRNQVKRAIPQPLPWQDQPV